MIFSHKSQEYSDYMGAHRFAAGRYNGAYYYSCEIVENIIPKVRTTRNWVTINIKGNCWDHSIVFIHNNLYRGLYEWLADYKDLVLVCGIPETCEKLKDLGRTIYLPLSVDVSYVEQFRRDKDRETCFAGRQEKRFGYDLGRNVTTLEDIPRDRLLTEMARYKKAYAVGRCAIEAKILGCEVLPYDKRFPDPSIWQVLDNKDAAKILRKQLKKIDG